MKLRDLKPGDEFEYAKTTPAYREGKFLVLDTSGCYLRPVAVNMSRFIFSYATKKVVRHYEGQEVIKKETNVKSQNQMGHFVRWEFGVPVTVHLKHCGDTITGRLIQETEKYFRILNSDRGVTSYNKYAYYYELIPYEYGSHHENKPRFPICKSPDYVAFCNSGNNMTTLDAGNLDRYEFLPISPPATFNIDGRVIKLSAETTANIKEQLGI